MCTAPILWSINTLAPSWQILYPKVLELSLSGSLTVSEQGSLTTIGEFLNVSALDPLLPTFLITTLCLCALSMITYYSLVIAWEVFWASQQSPSLLDLSAEVVLTDVVRDREKGVSVGEKIREKYDWCSSFLTVCLPSKVSKWTSREELTRYPHQLCTCLARSESTVGCGLLSEILSVTRAWSFLQHCSLQDLHMTHFIFCF